MRRLFVALSISLAMPAAAGEATAAGRYAAWQRCLADALARQPATSAHQAAVASALAGCRGRESAYLETLSASPLFDAGEIETTRASIRARATGTLMIAARERLDPVTTGSIAPRAGRARP